MLTELCFLSWCLQCLETVLHKFLPPERCESLIILLKISLGRLRASADCHGKVLVVVAWGACLEQVSASLINGTNQEANTEGSLSWMVSLDLWLLGNLRYQSLSGVVRVVSVPVVQAFSSHELAEVSGVSSQAGNGNTHVVINVEDFLLVTCEVMRALLKGDEDLKKGSCVNRDSWLTGKHQALPGRYRKHLRHECQT